MNEQQNIQLAKLVTYLLESEDWNCVWLNEYAEPIRLFMFKTGLTYRRIKKYIDEAMNKLLGPVYNKVQSKLRRKMEEPNDLFFKPKPKYVQQPKKPHHHNAGKSLIPWSEFGRKYMEHYGYGASKNMAQYMRERRIYKETGSCSWEIEK